MNEVVAKRYDTFLPVYWVLFGIFSALATGGLIVLVTSVGHSVDGVFNGVWMLAFGAVMVVACIIDIVMISRVPKIIVTFDAEKGILHFPTFDCEPVEIERVEFTKPFALIDYGFGKLKVFVHGKMVKINFVREIRNVCARITQLKAEQTAFMEQNHV